MKIRSINAEGAVQIPNGYMIPIDRIVVEQKNNNRFGTYTEADLRDLLRDIDSGKGIEIPVICRPSADRRPILVQGYRRYAAVKLWNYQHSPSLARMIPVIMRDMNDEEALESNVIENVHRKSLTPMDCAIGIRNLANSGRSEDEIGRIFDKSPAWVSQTRKLLLLDRALQRRIHDGKILGSAAIELADIADEHRGIVVSTIERDYNGKFSTTNIRKAGREIGAFGDGITPQDTDYANDDDLLTSHAAGHTPKRKQRTVREQNDYWDKWDGDQRLTEAGLLYTRLQLGFISGRVSDDEMDRSMLELFGRSFAGRI